MKPSKLPVSRRAGPPDVAVSSSEAYSDYDEFSSREGLVTHDGLIASYSDSAPDEDIAHAPLQSPSHGASLVSKSFNQKDPKLSFKRHLPRGSNPLVPDIQSVNPPTVLDYQKRIAELESHNTFLKFKLKLQLNDADAAELEVFA